LARVIWQGPCGRRLGRHRCRTRHRPVCGGECPHGVRRGPHHAEPCLGRFLLPLPIQSLRYFTEIRRRALCRGAIRRQRIFPDQPGVWFVTAQGLSCGILVFAEAWVGTGGHSRRPCGCITRIGWITGDTRAHYDWTLAIRFPAGLRRRVLMTIPPLTYITSEGTTCAKTTLDGSTYCERGPFRFHDHLNAHPGSTG